MEPLQVLISTPLKVWKPCLHNIWILMMHFAMQEKSTRGSKSNHSGRTELHSTHVYCCWSFININRLHEETRSGVDLMPSTPSTHPLKSPTDQTKICSSHPNLPKKEVSHWMGVNLKSFLGFLVTRERKGRGATPGDHGVFACPWEFSLPCPSL